jgi:hypothetical protein
MLFKALIERLLGSSEAQDWKELERARTSRFSYDDYPSLVGILSDLLNPEGPLKQSIESTPESSSPLDLHGAEGVFPALQILRQAQPPGANLETIVASVQKLLVSPHWHLRDMAARTMVSLRPLHQLYDAASALLDMTTEHHNLQHGILLTVKYTIRKLLANYDALGKTLAYSTALDSRAYFDADLETRQNLMRKLSDLAGRWYIPSDCPFVRSAFLDIVSLCGFSIIRTPDAMSLLNMWETLTSVLSIGPQYALDVSIVASDALLMQSLAQIFVLDRVILRDNALAQMVSKDYQSIGDALMLLATQDQDTCCAALDTLDKVLKSKCMNGITIPFDMAVAHIHLVLLHATDAEVISKAQSVLADALTDHSLQSSFFRLIAEDQVMLTLTKLEQQCLEGPPSNMQTALHLLGFFLDHAYTSHTTQRPSVLKAIARYIRLLRMTIIDTNPFDTRFAAVQSLSAIDHIWTIDTTSKATGPIILSLSFVLHDLLNDDDDEIRDAAALATSTLLRAQHHAESQDTVPILTCHRLAHFLSSTFSTSTELVREATRRLVDTTTPFAQQLAQARKEDTSLFATEKQNLYHDETLDAVLWSQILAHIQMPPTARSKLGEWAIDALSILTETAGKQEDGSLGWSSKADVFTLGIRVMCAAEVVGGSGVIVGLSKFADALRKSEGHGLWVEKIERVLERGVVGMLQRINGGLVGEFEMNLW